MKAMLLTLTVALVMSACSGNRNRVSKPSAELTNQQRIATQQRINAEKRRFHAQQREAQRQAKIQQENAQKQQQLAIDQFYDREFRQFLRDEGYNNASSLVSTSRARINFFRENPNPTEDQGHDFLNSLTSTQKQNIIKLEEPAFVELISKFEDDLQVRVNSQQNAQRQQALRALGQMGVFGGNQNRGNTGYTPASPGAILACGIKPFPPRLGCQFTQCVNGRWVEVCQ